MGRQGSLEQTERQMDSAPSDGRNVFSYWSCPRRSFVSSVVVTMQRQLSQLWQQPMRRVTLQITCSLAINILESLPQAGEWARYSVNNSSASANVYVSRVLTKQAGWQSLIMRNIKGQRPSMKIGGERGAETGLQEEAALFSLVTALGREPWGQALILQLAPARNAEKSASENSGKPMRAGLLCKCYLTCESWPQWKLRPGILKFFQQNNHHIILIGATSRYFFF